MDTVEEVKSRLDIVDIVGEYLPLKPAGTGSFRANCPFHNEKTPSFFVNRSRQSWHCFGCNIGGDMISFVQQIEGLDFIDALEHLANKAGVTLPAYNPETSGVKKRLQDLNDYAAKLLRHVLISDPEAALARQYVDGRGVDDLTADLWRLGYAPKDWHQLEKKFYAQGYTADELVKAGLASLKDSGSGIYFRFRERLMFPISDAMGHVVGFTGRILSQEKAAKYVNTPETMLYKKSMILYGLDKAKTDIKREDLAIIVEGNMDAITSHQFKVTNVVASSGTALTQDQLQLLKRYTGNIAISFDSDEAGLAATLRGLDVARQMDFNIKIISYDQNLGKDPDELIRKDVKLWQEAVSQAKPIMEWIYAKAFELYPAATPDGKKKIAQFVLNECRYVAHPVERDAWIGKLAKALDVDPESLRQALKRQPAAELKTKADQAPEPAKPAKTLNTQDKTTNELEAIWLAIALTKPQLFAKTDIQWIHPPHAKLYNLLEQSYNSAIPNQNQEPSLLQDKIAALANLEDDVKRLVDYLAILADREFQDATNDAISLEFSNIDNRLKELSIHTQRQTLELQMREAERLGDTEKINALLEQFSKLT